MTENHGSYFPFPTSELLHFLFQNLWADASCIAAMKINWDGELQPLG